MAAADYPDSSKPAGDSIRDIINPALNDERKQKIQLDILDYIFSNTAQQLSSLVGENLMSLFNKVSYVEPEERNAKVIRLLTMTDSQGRPLYSPIIKMGLPIVADFTDFTANDIRSLPGYIKLHEAARAANVAIKVSGLLKDERGMVQPHLVIDASKTYEQGALENAVLYPNLPDPPPPPVDPRKPGDFHL